jgi:multisubunit Na+/H+ antiporter MnhG subunit
MDIYKLLLIKSKIKSISLLILFLCAITCFILSIIKMFLHGYTAAIYFLLLTFFFWSMIKEIL